MGFFSGVVKLFTGNAPAIETLATTVQETAKGGLGLIDNAFFTDQEKSKANSDMVNAYIDLYKTTIQESTGTAEARRWFLQTITTYVICACTVSMACVITGNKEAAVVIVDMCRQFWIGEAFTAAVSFYYMTHVAKAIFEKPPGTKK